MKISDGKPLIMLRMILVAIALILCAQLVEAQVPSRIDINGILTYANGDVVANGTYGLIFRLYDNATPSDTTQAAGKVWSEHHASVSVSGGDFHVVLGLPTNPTPLSDLDFAEACWFDIEVFDTVNSTDWLLSPPAEFTRLALQSEYTCLDDLMRMR